MIGLKSLNSINNLKIESDKKVFNVEEKYKKDLNDIIYDNKNAANTATKNLRGNSVKEYLGNLSSNPSPIREKKYTKFTNLPMLSSAGSKIIGVGTSGGISNGGSMGINQPQHQQLHSFRKQEYLKQPSKNLSSKLVNYPLEKEIKDIGDNREDFIKISTMPIKKLHNNKYSVKNIRNIVLNLNNSLNNSGPTSSRKELPTSNRSSLEIFQENLYQENNQINKNINDLNVSMNRKMHLTPLKNKINYEVISETPDKLLRKNNSVNNIININNINNISNINNFSNVRNENNIHDLNISLTNEPKVLPNPMKKERDKERHNLSINLSSNNINLNNLNLSLIEETQINETVISPNLYLLELWIDLENVIITLLIII